MRSNIGSIHNIPNEKHRYRIKFEEEIIREIVFSRAKVYVCTFLKLSMTILGAMSYLSSMVFFYLYHERCWQMGSGKVKYVRLSRNVLKPNSLLIRTPQHPHLHATKQLPALVPLKDQPSVTVQDSQYLLSAACSLFRSVSALSTMNLSQKEAIAI